MNSEPNFKRIERIEPVIKADELAYVAFERKDATKMSQFLVDFGLVPLEWDVGTSLYFRAQGTAPYCVEIVPSDRDGFKGLGYFCREFADLEKLSAESGMPIEDVDAPGGGKRVRLTHPDGWQVDVIHGFTPAPPLGSRQDLIPLNTPTTKLRVNEGVRTPLEPTAVYRVGHIVFFTPDFEASLNWFMRWIGFLPTDVLTDADGIPCGGFFRLNRGDQPADHHNLALFPGEESAVHHVSTEAVDIDSIGQGQQYLRARGWSHFWGIGRHILGSQFFDYWHDPVGLEWEHYADGDVMTEDFEEGYYLISREELWAWGDDLPDVSKPEPGAVENAPDHMKGMLVEWEKPARPWLA